MKTISDTDPMIFIRRTGKSWGVSHYRFDVYRKRTRNIFKQAQMSQELDENGKQNRLPFARRCWRRLRNDARYLQRIVFSDECKFSLSGKVRQQNCRI